jgi:hypothetical protein
MKSGRDGHANRLKTQLACIHGWRFIQASRRCGEKVQVWKKVFWPQDTAHIPGLARHCSESTTPIRDPGVRQDFKISLKAVVYQESTHSQILHGPSVLKIAVDAQ